MVIQVLRPATEVRAELLHKYGLTKDAEIFILPCLEPEHANALFLASLSKESRFHLTNAAAVMVIGPGTIRAISEKCVEAIGAGTQRDN